MERLSAVVITAICVLAGWEAFQPRADVRAGNDPGIYLDSQRAIGVTYEGPDELARALDAGRGAPLTLTTADIDNDGFADLIAGYSVDGRGAIAIFQGNPEAFVPQRRETLDGIRKHRFPSPMRGTAVALNVPARPDFLVTGDFSGAGRTEIALAAANGDTVYVLSRNDNGEWRVTQSLPAGGSISRMAAYRFDEHQSVSHILVGIRDDSGPKLAVYGATTDGVRPVETIGLPGDVAAFEFGDLDGDGVADAGVIAGEQLLVMRGSALTGAVSRRSAPRLESIELPYGVRQVAFGNFVFDRNAARQIAVAATNGTIHILAHERGAREFSAGGMRRAEARPPARSDAWKDIESFSGMISAGAPAQMFRSRLSGNTMDDVVVLDPGADSLSVIAHQDHGGGLVFTRREALAGIAAALPARVNVDARSGIVMLRAGNPTPLTMMPLAARTFTVDTTSDFVSSSATACARSVAAQCSLRQAVREANTTAGHTTILVPEGVYTLTIAGELGITNGVSIVGVGPAVIQAGTTRLNGMGRVFSVNPLGALPGFDAHLSNITVRFGRNQSSFGSGNGNGGTLDFNTGTTGTGNLAITDGAIEDSSTTDGNGGALAVASPAAGPGTLTLTNVRLQNNAARRASAEASGLGGGLYSGAGARVVMTGGSITGNAAGSGGGIYAEGSGAVGGNAFRGVSIQSNQASGSGGGIYTAAGITIEPNGATGTDLSGNSAAAGGGGVWLAGGETSSIRKTTLASNSSSGNGGAIGVAAADAPRLTLAYNRFSGNSASTGNNLSNGGGAAIDAARNWWGTNEPAVSISGDASFVPWIVLTHTGTPSVDSANSSARLTASFLQDSANGDVPAQHLDRLIGLGATFRPVVSGGVLDAQPVIQPTATANATATEGDVDVTVDNTTVRARIARPRPHAEAPPTLSLSFTSASVRVSQPSGLQISIQNPASNADPLTNVGLSITLPAGLHVNNASQTPICPGGGQTGTVTLTNPSSIVLTGAQVDPGTPCPFTITIRTDSAGSYDISGFVTSANGGTSSTESTNLKVFAAPTLTATFGAPTVALDDTVTLTFDIANPNSFGVLDSLAFSKTLPSGLVVANPSVISNSCGGTATANAGASTVSLTAGSVAASGSCSLAFILKATSIGTKNISLQVNSSQGGPSNTSSTSTDVLGAPTLVKAFGAPSVALNGSTSLTFTVTNPNTSSALAGVAFSDSLPAGLVVATPNGLSGSCSGTVTATAGSGTVGLTGGSVGASSSCTFSVNVTGTDAGTKSNTTGNISTTNAGTGGTASASIDVVAPPTIAKAFNPTYIALGGTTLLTFTITNPAANAVALTGVSLSDTLPAGLTVPNTTATVCGGGTITVTNATSIVLTGVTIAANGQCSFSPTVTGTASGQYTNTTGNITSANGGTGLTASANLTVASPPTITKAFGAAAILLGGSTTLTFSIANPNDPVALTGVAFTDTLPAGLVVSSPNGLTGSCGGTITAVAGSGSISLSGATLASAGCTFSVNVTSTSAGIKNNSTQVTSTEGGTGNTTNASITVVGPPVLLKGFGAASVPLNGSTSLTFTVSNPNGINGLTGIAFSDLLPSGLTVATPSGAAGTCLTTAGQVTAAASLTATAGSNSIGISGLGLTASGSCSFSVDVTGTSAGTKFNATSSITATNGGTGNSATATLNVYAPPTIAKSFTPTVFAVGIPSTLTFTITNPPANPASLTGIGFTDTLPAGLVVAAPNGLTSSCGGGTISAVAGAAVVSLSGATLASGSCTFSVQVLGTTAGVFVNTTGNVTSSEGGIGNTASATLTIQSAASGLTPSPLGGALVVRGAAGKVIYFDAGYNKKYSFGSTGTGNGQFKPPAGVAFAPNGYILVTDAGNDRVVNFDPNLIFRFNVGGPGAANGQLESPAGIAVTSAGLVWVVDTLNSRVEVFDSNGVYKFKFGTFGTGHGQFSAPAGIALLPNGYVAVSDTGNARIQVFDSNGNFKYLFGAPGSGNGQFNLPAGLTVDAAGNFVVADMGNNRVQVFDGNGNYRYKFGTAGTSNGQFTNPTSVMVVPGTGYIWVLDEGNNRIQVFDQNATYRLQFPAVP